MVVTPDTDLFSDPRPSLFLLKGICDQQMYFCIPSHVKSTDKGLINLFQLKDFLIWTVTHKIFEIVACYDYIFIQYILGSDGVWQLD